MIDNKVIQIQNLAKKYFPEIVRIRRDIHMHPELSFQEKNTAEKVKGFLKNNGIEFTDQWAGHGVVATIKGADTGDIIMLRADMDALPITEQNDISYKSVNDGVMHACGHDVHTSSLLGTAAIINELKKDFKGEVKLIFQPGEEKLPGGASIMIKEGLFDQHPADCIIAQHVFPNLPAGHVGFKSGLYMASADEFYITIKGKGGHAATPHLTIDPILLASRVVVGLQEIISRRIDPMTQAVLTIGKVYSDGGATNVIPDKVFLEGTLRAMDEKWRYKAHQMITDFVNHTCLAAGATSDIKIEIGYPSLKNDVELTESCRNAAIQYLGKEKVHDLPARMSSEDFAFYTHSIPGTFYRLGTGWDDPSRNIPVHSNLFNIDEDALATGMGLMAFIAISRLI